MAQTLWSTHLRAQWHQLGDKHPAYALDGADHVPSYVRSVQYSFH